MQAPDHRRPFYGERAAAGPAGPAGPAAIKSVAIFATSSPRGRRFALFISGMR